MLWIVKAIGCKLWAMIINVNRLKLSKFEIAINKCCLFFAFCCCYIGYVMPSCPLLFSPQIKKNKCQHFTTSFFNHFTTCTLFYYTSWAVFFHTMSVLVHFALEKNVYLSDMFSTSFVLTQLPWIFVLWNMSYSTKFSLIWLK